MSKILLLGGKIAMYVWRNRSWLIPLTIEGYNVLKRWRKINKLKRAQNK